jgi:hypothetical protein
MGTTMGSTLPVNGHKVQHSLDSETMAQSHAITMASEPLSNPPPPKRVSLHSTLAWFINRIKTPEIQLIVSPHP